MILPIAVLAKYTDVENLKEGDQITVLDGHEICKKYIPRGNRRTHSGGVKVSKNKKEEHQKISYPFFTEHIDTEQLAYNQQAFRENDIVYLTRTSC